MKNNENVVSIQIPDKDFAAMQAKAQELKGMLAPYLIGLSAEER
ncbi:MAG: hypothetical protein AAF632_11815 [Bacteroidota bacterium]